MLNYILVYFPSTAAEVLLKCEGRGQGTIFKGMTRPQHVAKTAETSWIQDGRRVNFQWTPSPINALPNTLAHKAGTTTSHMTVLSPAIKGQTLWALAQSLEILTSSPK